MLNDTSITTAWFVGDDATTELPFTFKCLAQDQLLVKRENSDGTNTTLNYDSEYTVTLNADQENDPGGTVTLVTALATGTRAVVASGIPYTQPLDLQNAGRYHLQRIEDALDRATLQIRQIAEEAIRSLRFPLGDTANGELPPADVRAGMLVQFDASGNVAVADPGNVSLSSADFEVARAKRLIVGYDDDSDITDQTTALQNHSQLVRYSTAYANKLTKNGVYVQRYVKEDVGSVGGSFKSYTLLGAEDGSTTPAIGDYQPEWALNVELDDYSDLEVVGVPSVGISSTIRRYAAQPVIGAHINAMDMRVPDSATDATMGGVTGIECHSDAIGPDHRSGNHAYGYRQTIRCTARTQKTTPDWVKRGTAPYGNSTLVLRDAICLPKNAVLTEEYIGPYFVCISNPSGTTGVVDTVLDATTTPGTVVTDGTVEWECRIGTEVGIGLIVRNGSADFESVPGYYRFGIIVDNASRDGNVNQVGTAFYAYNSGTINYGSLGAPQYHAWFSDTEGTCTVLLGSQNSTNASTSTQIIHKADDANGGSQTISSWTTQLVDNTVGAIYGRTVFTVTVNDVGEQHLILEDKNVIIGEKAALAVGAAEGFLHIPKTTAGAPSGTPTMYTGKAPIVWDNANNKLCVYNGTAWKTVTLA